MLADQAWRHLRVAIDGFSGEALKLNRAPLHAPKPEPPSLYPKELNTLGDWIRKNRLDRGLSQAQASRIFGVTECYVVNWELHHSKSEIRYYPRIFAFLGYCPYTPSTDLIDRLKAARQALGFTQQALREILQVDQTTIAEWERKEHRPGKKLRERIQRFLLP